MEGNLMSMAELAEANGIRVVLASVPPAIDFPWRRCLAPAAKIVALNAWITGYCERRGFVYLDYYSVLSDDDGALRTEFTADGVHPNESGYKAMTPLAVRAIARALAAK
jgi:lysophospholipase L1-like esterase